MSCVRGLSFLFCNTLVKVPLLQAGTVVIWTQMFKSDVYYYKPQQTNKKQIMKDTIPINMDNMIIA